jgi:polysaccharide deacetylase family protein (PEP-CTERM system associated)
MSNKRILMLSFDIEDWFHAHNLKGCIKNEDWDKLELRVWENTMRILHLLDLTNTKATFFILGWIAERVPKLVLELDKRGHEIASHGYSHELVYEMDKESFRRDVRKSKQILEDLTGKRIIGYRAPSFSITEWAIDILKEEGFLYDSSLFPAIIHDRYGEIKSIPGKSKLGIESPRENFYEILIPTLNILNLRFSWGGGGYFRVIPYIVYKYGVKKILNSRLSFVFYFHPWEIDIFQPKVKELNLMLKIRQYTGMKRAEKKLIRLIRDFKFTSIETGLKILKLI